MTETVWHLLTGVHDASQMTHMNAARNSMYWVYVDHCQKENGLVEAPKFSRLSLEWKRMQIYKSANWMYST